jgi:DNA modification methylase
LLNRIIEASTNVGDLVFDPFMGSGTTGVAALMLKRRFVGIEADHAHFELARARVGAAHENAQGTLFTSEAVAR